MIDEIRTRYRAIRRQVYEQATEPADVNEQRHTENKIRFRDAVVALCEQANLSHCDARTQAARIALWHHLWTKNRYAGIRAQIATTDIDQLTALFDNYHWFCDGGWDIQSKGYQLRAAGNLARSFLERTGHFAAIQTIGNVPKLKKIVAVARHFKRFFDDNPDGTALDFVTRGLPLDDVWAIHHQLKEIGYTGILPVSTS